MAACSELYRGTRCVIIVNDVITEVDTMIRTQVQLTEAQVKRLKVIAARRKVSMATIVRLAVDSLPAPGDMADPDERRRRAIAAIGRFRSGSGDGAARHDVHLADAYTK